MVERVFEEIKDLSPEEIQALLADEIHGVEDINA